MKDLRKTLYLGSSLCVKLIAGLIAVKLCAQTLGPESFGITGQLSSLLSVITLLAGAGVSVGVTKIYAGDEFPKEERRQWIKAARLIVLLSALILVLLLSLTSFWIAGSIFKESPAAMWLVVGLLLSVFPIAYAGIGQGKINGLHREDVYSLSVVSGSVLGLLGLWLCTRYLGPNGALLGMIWLPVAQAIFMIFFGMKIAKSLTTHRHLDRPPAAGEIKSKINFLLGYGSLSIAAGTIMPIVYIGIRLAIQEYNNNEIFGLWQATLRISEAYCQLPMLMLTVVFFSRFAGSASSKLQSHQALKAYGLIFWMMAGIAAFVYFTRASWIEIVFTPAFKGMGKYVPWQLTGDTLRVLSYVGTTILAARGNVRLCICAEVFQGTLLILSSVLLIPRYHEYGAYYAYTSTYLIYFTITLLLVLKFKDSRIQTTSTRS